MTGDERTLTAPVRRGGGLRSWAVPLVLLGLAGLLLADPWPYVSPPGPAEETPAWAYDISTVRTPSLRPEITIAGHVYRCTACHALFPSPPETDRPLTEHRDIKMEHGINNRCFNCHHPTDRDALVDDRGDPIPYDQPQWLCAKCHGPVYRDWTHGVHGRTNGYWSDRLGPVEHQRCIACHDPHSPMFQPMKPAPGPYTPRMGDQRSGPRERAGDRNPLLIYRQESPDGQEAGATRPAD